MNKNITSIGILFSVIAILVLALASQAYADINVITSEPGRLSLSYESGPAQQDTFLADGISYSRITLNGHFISAEQGYPALPVLTVQVGDTR